MSNPLPISLLRSILLQRCKLLRREQKVRIANRYMALWSIGLSVLCPGGPLALWAGEPLDRWAKGPRVDSPPLSLETFVRVGRSDRLVDPWHRSRAVLTDCTKKLGEGHV